MARKNHAGRWRVAIFTFLDETLYELLKDKFEEICGIYSSKDNCWRQQNQEKYPVHYLYFLTYFQKM